MQFMSRLENCIYSYSKPYSFTFFFLFISEPQIRQTILAKNGIERISSLLSHGCEDIVQKSLATLIQLDSSEVHAIIFNEKNISIAKKYIDSSFIPLKNLSNSFIQRK